MSDNTWTQIHTNGASTTFARYYGTTDDTGAQIYVFEKLATDHVNGIAEIFGREEFTQFVDALNRFRTAQDRQY